MPVGQLSLYKTALAAVRDPVCITDSRGVILDVNPAYVTTNGFTREESIGRTPAILRSGVTEPATYRLLWTALLAKRAWAGEVVNRRKDGTTYVADLLVCPVVDDGGDIVGFIGTHRNISPLLRIEDALRRADESFRAFMELSPDAIAVHRDGRIVYANPGLLRLLGHQGTGSLVGRALDDIVHPDDRADVGARVESLLGRGEGVPVNERRLLRADGGFVVTEVLSLAFDFAGAPAVVDIARDATERQQLTQRLVQMDRVITIGTLAAGVGHEINNPLTYVSANVTFALEELGTLKDRLEGGEGPVPEGAVPALDEVLETLEEAKFGCDRIREVVRDLRMFARGDDDKRRALDLRRVVGPALDMANHELRHRATVELALEEVPPVLGNEAKLSQVVLNLLINAAHAIDEGTTGRNEIRVRSFARQQEVVLEVRDSGVGIAPEHLPRIFDAFFTTKSAAQGTGLGLSICRRIVEAHGGRMEVESELGVGSAFRIVLPAAPAQDAGEPTSSAEAGAAPRRGRLLVIDDEPAVARILARVLGTDHDVVAFTSAKEALLRIDAGEPFDLIICDLMMPEMTGMDLYEALQERDRAKAASMVFLTGGAFTPRAQALLNTTSNVRLDKPFNPDDLRKRVGQLIR